MSETSVLKESTFPLNDNLRAIEENAVGKYPFVFLLEPNTVEKLQKLSCNLKALGKRPIDTNKIINEALASALDGLITKNKHPHEEPAYLVPQCYLHPEAGDWWHEMFGSYLTVMEVIDDNDFVVHVVVNLAGLEPGLYRINRQWLARMVAYDGKALFEKADADITPRDFVADPIRRGGDEKRASWYEENKGETKDIRHFAPTYK